MGRVYATKYYNIDAILSVGYRVNSKNATSFRRWATHTLKEFLLHGYSSVQLGFNPFGARTGHPHPQLRGRLGASVKNLGKKLFAFNRMEVATEELLNDG